MLIPKPIIFPKFALVDQKPNNKLCFWGSNCECTIIKSIGQVYDCMYPLIHIRIAKIQKFERIYILKQKAKTPMIKLQESKPTQSDWTGFLIGKIAWMKCPMPKKHNIKASTIPTSKKYLTDCLNGCMRSVREFGFDWRIWGPYAMHSSIRKECKDKSFSPVARH